MIEETLEEAAEKYVDNKHKPAAGIPNKGIQNFYDCKNAFKDGAKWQAERMYSEEEVHIILNSFKSLISSGYNKPYFDWFEQFKKK